MDARLQLRVQRYGWDAAAPHYEAGWQEQILSAQTTLLKMADLAPGQAVLETACGSGLMTRRIAEAIAPGGTVLATDLSQRMVDATTALGIAGVQTARMNAEALDVEEGVYDRALCALGLMYVPDPGKAIAEMRRVLKPGGRAAATVWGERRNCGWAEIFPIVDKQVESEVCPLFFATGAPNGLTRAFERAGFARIEEHRQSQVLTFPDRKTLLDAILLGGPVALAVSRFSGDQMLIVSDEFLASVAAFERPDGGYEIPGEFVTVAGVRVK